MGSYRLVKMLNPISITVNGTFTPKGAYNAGTSYSVGDQVDYNGTSYILYSAASAGTLPTDNTKWGVLASKGDTGATGLKGDKGDTGLTGAAGTNGQGVPTGGTTGQQLAKINGTDYNTQWVNPVDISGKQDTLVSGTSIKTINSTSLLGSGDIVIGGAVDSVNTQTGVVVLDTDDIAEGTNKYVTSAEKTILSNTSGVNTGDQDISGIATNASNITNKVSKAGDTMTGDLNVLNIKPVTAGTYGIGNSSYGFSSLYLKGSGSSDVVNIKNQYNNTLFRINQYDELSTINFFPAIDKTYSLGYTSLYWLNTYTQKLYLNSTASLDGSTAGQIQATGILTADNIKRGTGFPNGVVTANVGTVYIDTAITNGASSWVKKSGTGNTGWVVLEGDTGWRDVTSIFTNFEVVNPNDKGIRWRREGSTNYIEGSCQIKSLSTSVITIDTAMASRSDAVVIRFEGQGTTTEIIDLKTLGTAMYPVPSAAASVGRRGYFNTSYGASQSQAITWPSTLPGTAI
jgi:hypothetical protein